MTEKTKACKGRKAKPAASKQVPSIMGTVAAEIVPLATEWLWPGRIPRGSLTILDGDPGSGKTMMAIMIAAAVSKGQALPGGDTTKPASVVFMTAEDDQARTIRPRLEAAGADLTRVIVSDGSVTVGEHSRTLMLPGDADAIRCMVEDKGVKLFVFDPIMAFLNPDTNPNDSQGVREALGCLRDIAEQTGATFIGIRHLNKSSAGGSALYRGSGSIAICAVARSVLLAAALPGSTDEHVLAVVKCNLAPKPPALRYAIDTVGDVPVIGWRGEVELSADDLVPAAVPVRPLKTTRVSECVTWLVEFVSEWAWPDSELQIAAVAAGFTADNLKDAKARLRNAEPPLVGKPRERGGEWWNWIGPKDKPSPPRPHTPETPESPESPETWAGNKTREVSPAPSETPESPESKKRRKEEDNTSLRDKDTQGVGNGSSLGSVGSLGSLGKCGGAVPETSPHLNGTYGTRRF